MIHRIYYSCSECKTPVRGRGLCLTCEMIKHSAGTAQPYEACTVGQFRALSIHWFLRPPRYTVRWGYCFQQFEEFGDFERALACYSDHRDDAYGAEIVGAGEDADCDEDGFCRCSDGLTEEERERVDGLSS